MAPQAEPRLQAAVDVAGHWLSAPHPVGERLPATRDADERPASEASAASAASAALLPLIWLASPALPVGGFSYSEALEGAVDAGLVSDEATARDWLVDQIHLIGGRCDLVIVAAAFAAFRLGDIDTATLLNAWFATTRESAEAAQQSAQMGRSLVQWLKNLHPATPGLGILERLQPTPQWPTAFAFAAARTEATLAGALTAFAFAWAENMVQAAVKSVPLGQNAGQRLLAALAAETPGLIEVVITRPVSACQAFAPRLAILAARHELQYSRLFRS